MVEAAAATYRELLITERERVREQLRQLGHDGERSGSERERSGVGRPSVGGRSAGGRSERTTAIARTDIELVADSARTAAIAVNGARHRPRRTVQEAEA